MAQEIQFSTKAVKTIDKDMQGFIKNAKLAATEIQGVAKKLLLLAQAHVDTGIMSRALAQVAGKLREVGAAAKNAFAPLMAALVPVLNTVGDAVIRVLNGMGALMRLLFGTAGGYEDAGSAASGYAKSAGKAAAATKKATGALAAFDSLDVLEPKQESGSYGSGGNVASVPVEGTKSIELLDRLLHKAKEVAAFFTELFSPSITAWGQAFDALKKPIAVAMAQIKDAALVLWRDGLLPLAKYVLTDFVPGIANAFSETFAPIFRDVASFAILEFGNTFAFVCGMLTSGIQDILLPALAFIKDVIVGMLEGVKSAWEKYGGAILARLSEGLEKVRALMQSVYDTIILPIAEKIGEIIDGLWNKHLRPLWDSLMLLFGAVGEMMATFWSNVLVPFVAWIVDTFGPIIVGAIGWIGDIFSDVFGGIIDLITGLVEALTGVMEFLTGVFAGDWQRAWDGINKVFEGILNGMLGFAKGIINGIIGAINGLIGGVVAGVNTIISAINTIRVDIPDWVPGIGGMGIGFSIPPVSAPKIPLLAQGAVIPPNREFLAVLGDQKSGTNLEAPEGLIRQILREEMANAGGGDVNIRFTGSLAQLARVLKPEIERENMRRGASLATGMG